MKIAYILLRMISVTGEKACCAMVHGFTTLSDKAVMLYQCDGAYDSETDAGIRYDDEEIGIDWTIEADKIILFERDKVLMSFSEFERKMWQCRGWSKICL